METKDLILRKAVFEDWKAMYQNVWSQPEAAQYMQWQITSSEKAARERIQKTIHYQKTHDTYLICGKKNNQAIGFAGIEEIAPHIFQEAGIALGPKYVGRGYGKQTLLRLLEYCTALGGKEFYYTTRCNNIASVALAISCGLSYCRSEQKADIRTAVTYTLNVYNKKL